MSIRLWLAVFVCLSVQGATEVRGESSPLKSIVVTGAVVAAGAFVAEKVCGEAVVTKAEVAYSVFTLSFLGALRVGYEYGKKSELIYDLLESKRTFSFMDQVIEADVLKQNPTFDLTRDADALRYDVAVDKALDDFHKKHGTAPGGMLPVAVVSVVLLEQLWKSIQPGKIAFIKGCLAAAGIGYGLGYMFGNNMCRERRESLQQLGEAQYRVRQSRQLVRQVLRQTENVYAQYQGVLEYLMTPAHTVTVIPQGMASYAAALLRAAYERAQQGVESVRSAASRAAAPAA